MPSNNHEKAISQIVTKSLRVDNATGAAGSSIQDDDLLSFGSDSSGIDGLMIQHNDGTPTSFHKWSSNGADEKFFSIGNSDILEADFEDGANTIRFYFIFPFGVDVDVFYFYFDETINRAPPLVLLSLQGNQNIEIQGIVPLGDPPIGGPGPKT